MNFSLIDKFRGAWLGNYLGSYLLDTDKSSSQDSRARVLGVGKIAELGAESLIKIGYLDLGYWQEQIRLVEPNLLGLARSLQLSEAIQAALPIILFYHEQPQKLTPAILSTLDFWLHSQESVELGLGMAEAIAFLLKKNPDPQEIIDQTRLGQIFKLPPQFWQELPCLELAIKEINRRVIPSYVPMAIACYGFLGTPEDFSLSLRRAKIAPESELVTPLVGILSGAYNGLGGIPFRWSSELVNLQVIDQLFAIWAGHYQGLLDTTSWQNQMVTAPSLK